MRARQLLTEKRAAVWRRYPFTIILKKQIKNPGLQPSKLKIDPGSKVTGLAIVIKKEEGEVVWAANIEHRGNVIKLLLDKRRIIRKSRRRRKTRYRKPRFNNRRSSKPKGWLPPSLLSRVNNITTWTLKLQKLIPNLNSVSVEIVTFDTQKMQNPEIRNWEYQRGELLGYEIKAYLLEKYSYKCVYCGKKNIKLEMDHVVPKSKGGSNRVSNFVIACHSCNQKKGDSTVEKFLRSKPILLRQILKTLKSSLKDTAAVNSTKKELVKKLKILVSKVNSCDSSRTYFNRNKRKIGKDHWVDAACVGKSGKTIVIPYWLTPLSIKAIGRGNRQVTRMNKYGFPMSKARTKKVVNGFQTGDIVAVNHKKGIFTGRIGLTNGTFVMKIKSGSIRFKTDACSMIQKFDGYNYKF
jgi:5-methylcytosine-specific restriction endonuclease McrA